MKLFAKVLASHLKAFVTKLVHNDQTDFIKSYLAADNVHNVSYVLEC